MQWNENMDQLIINMNLYRQAIMQEDLLMQQAENVMNATIAMIRKYEED